MKDYSRTNASISRSYRRHARRRTGSLYFKMVLLVVFVAAVWLVASPYGLIRLYKLREEKSRLMVAMSQIEETNALLKQNIDRFENDKKFRERMVRRELGWLKDGERIYRFMED